MTPNAPERKLGCSENVAVAPSGVTHEYPKRSRFFALKFCRIMAKTCLANEIGADACWLLSVIAHTEDAKGYRGAVTFFNGQLAPLVACGTDDALNRVRGRAVRAGWLVYIPGGKSKAGRYWVQIPEQHRDWDDAPTDETDKSLGYDSDGCVVYSPTKTQGEAEGKPRRSAGRTLGEAEGKPRGSADHSSCFCS